MIGKATYHVGWIRLRYKVTGFSLELLLPAAAALPSAAVVVPVGLVVGVVCSGGGGHGWLHALGK
jgi:hypothetical protein